MPQLNTPSSSMTSTALKKPNGTTATSMLNTDFILEISKTAQLLSNQLLMLHKNLAQPQQTPVKNTFEFTPLSSGYNSICSSYENISISNSRYVSKEYTPKYGQSLASDQSSLNLSSSSPDSNILKRVLFDSDSDKSLSTPSSSDSSFNSSKKRKFQLSVDFSTPHRGKRQQPTIPRIKEVRKKLKKLSSLEKSKLRRYYNDFADID